MLVAVRDAAATAEPKSAKETDVRLASQCSRSFATTCRLSAQLPLALQLLAAILCFAPASLFAQVPGQEPVGGDSVFVPAPRELTRPIELTWRALEEEKYAEAVDRFAEILFAEDSVSYFVQSDTTPGLWTNLRLHQQNLMQQFPQEAKDLFELKFGIEAQKLLDEAIQNRDWQTIVRISQDYLHCKAGYDASMIVGRRYLDEGQSPSAARQFERVLDSEIGRAQWTPEVQLLAATAQLAMGRTEEAYEALATLPDQSWQATVGGEDVDPSQEAEQLATWLSERIGNVPALQRLAESNWVMFRGNPQRNGVSSAGFPLLINRWRVPTMLRASDRTIANSIKRRWIEDGRSTIPSVNAIAVGNSVIMRTPTFIVGVDLNTGLRTWYYPWDAADELSDSADASGPSVGNSPEQELHERMWLDGIHGQMSSDGRRVFFVDNLSYRLGLSRNTRVVNPRGPVIQDSNTLVALRLFDDNGAMVEGKMDWIIGGESGNDQPWSAGVFFLGPPLPLEGVLYALGEVRNEVRLFAIEGLTANLLWDSQVAVTGVGSPEDRIVRQVAGATPSVADDLLICPTSTGAVVAVDRISHSPLWGYQYRPLSVGAFGVGMQVSPWRPGERWADSTVLLSDGIAVLNPPEHQELIALDQSTGAPLWSKPRGDASWVAGVQAGALIVVGNTEVIAYELRSGTEKWKCSLADHGVPSGRGYLTSDRVFLPTTERQVVSIDLSNGAIADYVDTEYVLGNMICHQGTVISHDVDWLAAFYQDESNRPVVAEQLKANPDDERALLLQAQLHARDRQWSEAITTVERAAELAPDRLEVRQAMVEIIMLTVRNETNMPIEQLAPHEHLILDSEYRNEYLIRKTAQLHASGQYREMVAGLIGMLRTITPDGTEQQSLMKLGDRDFSVVAWARSLAEDSLQNAAVLAEVEDLIAQARGEAVAAGNYSEMRKLDQVFGKVSNDSWYRLETAKGLRVEGKALEAEAILAELLTSSDAQLRSMASVETIQLLDDFGFTSQAQQIAQRLLEETESFPFGEGRTTADFATDFLAGNQATNREAIPGGRLIVTDSDQAGSQQMRSQQDLMFDSVQGLLAPSFLDFRDLRSQILIRDQTGVALATVNVNEGGWSISQVSRAHLINHLLVIDLQFSTQGHELIGIDLFKAINGDAQPIIWRHRLFGDSTRPIGIGGVRSQSMLRIESRAVALGFVVTRSVYDSHRVGAYSDPTLEGLVFLKEQLAHCIDPMTGNVLWRRHGLKEGGSVYSSSDRVWILGEDESTVSELSMVDGSDMLGRELEPFGIIFGFDQGVAVGVDSSGNGFKLIGRDLGTGDEAWSLELTQEARGQLLNGDRLALLENDGRFRVVSLRNGESLFEATIPVGITATSIQWVEDSFGSLLVINQNQVTSRQNSRQMNDVSLMGVLASPLVDGVVYAFDREGRAMWPSKVVVEQYSVMTQELNRSPVLVLSRYYSLKEQGGQPANYMDLVLIDRRSGRLIWDETAISLAGRIPSWNVDFDPTTGVTQVSGPRRYVVAPSEEPMPPGPAALTGMSASGATQRPASVRRIFDGIGRALLE